MTTSREAKVALRGRGCIELGAQAVHGLVARDARGIHGGAVIYFPNNHTFAVSAQLSEQKTMAPNDGGANADGAAADETACALCFDVVPLAGKGHGCVARRNVQRGAQP